MSIVRVERNEDGFVIKPFLYGSRFGVFKKSGDAKLAAEALNMAYKAGRESLASDVRDLFSVSTE